MRARPGNPSSSSNRREDWRLLHRSLKPHLPGAHALFPCAAVQSSATHSSSQLIQLML